MKHLKFKGASDAGHFEYYDKESGENVKYKLGEIAVTNVCYTVKGWDEASNSAIYSNDITSFNDEEFNVKSKGGTLVSGIYKDIKEDIINKGAKLHIKVVGVSEGEEISITLKGLNFFQISETLKDIDTDTTKLAFDKTEDDKKGAVKFKKTIFKAGGKIKDGDLNIKGGEESADISVEDIPF